MTQACCRDISQQLTLDGSDSRGEYLHRQPPIYHHLATSNKRRLLQTHLGIMTRHQCSEDQGLSKGHKPIDQ